MTKVFRLDWDYDHLGDSEKDAFHSPFDGCNSLESDLLNGKPISIEQEIIFQANFAVISKIDFPLTDLRVLVLSKKMLNVIQKIAPFKYQFIPVKMIDDTYLRDRYDSNGTLKSDIPFNNNFIILQILEICEFIDDEASIYKESKALPGFKRYKKIVIRKPKEGFPPIFKLNGSMSKTYVTEETKLKLLGANIQGCVFEEVEVTDVADI